MTGDAREAVERVREDLRSARRRAASLSPREEDVATLLAEHDRLAAIVEQARESGRADGRLEALHRIGAFHRPTEGAAAGPEWARGYAGCLDDVLGQLRLLAGLEGQS